MMMRATRHKGMRLLPVLGALVAILSSVVACTIEPPLRLAEGNDLDVKMGDVVVDIDVIWELNTEWRSNWWYGWDELDEAEWGSIDYPKPSNYEVRFYYLGLAPSQPHKSFDKTTVFGERFRRNFQHGYHNLMIWSNIDSPDGTQVLMVDESDVTDIRATTSRSRIGYIPPSTPVSRAADVFNSPEIFYSTHKRDIYISDKPEEYDYFDEERQVWVKNINAQLDPMVYIYLVQVAVYNNRGRILGTADHSSISSLADGVSLHTGYTSNNDVVVAYDMRLKKDIPARDGRPADIFGGKFTTFGLCGMEPWSKGRGPAYTGPRPDLMNHLALNFAFSNSTDSVYNYDITPQMQSQAHGGVITIEIDMDTLKIPQKRGAGGSVFDPTVVPRDSVEHEIEM